VLDLEAQLDALADRVAQRVSLLPPRDVRILSAEQAAEYVGRPKSQTGSLRTFYDWAERTGAKPCGHDRWPLRNLDAGLRKERDGRAKKPSKRKTPAQAS
jgi:hypothetical protein